MVHRFWHLSWGFLPRRVWSSASSQVVSVAKAKDPMDFWWFCVPNDPKWVFLELGYLKRLKSPLVSYEKWTIIKDDRLGWVETSKQSHYCWLHIPLHLHYPHRIDIFRKNHFSCSTVHFWCLIKQIIPHSIPILVAPSVGITPWFLQEIPHRIYRVKALRTASDASFKPGRRSMPHGTRSFVSGTKGWDDGSR